MTLTKPMLAGKCTDIHKLKYPVLATPKLDGIRCLIVNLNGMKQAVSRNFKPIPNNYVRTWLEEVCPIGFDGELIVPGGTFQQTSSAIMSRDGTPDFVYKVFDLYADEPYWKRMSLLETIGPSAENVQFVLPHDVVGPDDLEVYEECCIEDGFEGVILRSPNGPYKCGRSTEKEGFLLKLKRFEDGEAIITDCIEKMHNENPAEIDELGRTKRSSHKANKIPMGVLGALVVKDCKTKVQFQVGSGFDDSTRENLWKIREVLPGKIIKYKFQNSGIKDKPRFPTFLGLRSSLP